MPLLIRTKSQQNSLKWNLVKHFHLQMSSTVVKNMKFALPAAAKSELRPSKIQFPLIWLTYPPQMLDISSSLWQHTYPMVHAFFQCFLILSKPAASGQAEWWRWQHAAAAGISTIQLVLVAAGIGYCSL